MVKSRDTAEEFDRLLSDAAWEFEKNLENAERLFVSQLKNVMSMMDEPQRAFYHVPIHLRQASVQHAMKRAQSEADRVVLALRAWNAKESENEPG